MSNQANQAVPDRLLPGEMGIRWHTIALTYLSSFIAQMVVYLSAATQVDHRMSPNFILFWALVFSLLSVMPGTIAALLRNLTGFGAMLLGTLVGLAMLFGFIYLPRLLLPNLLSFG